MYVIGITLCLLILLCAAELLALLGVARRLLACLAAFSTVTSEHGAILSAISQELLTTRIVKRNADKDRWETVTWISRHNENAIQHALNTTGLAVEHNGKIEEGNQQ